MTTIITKNGSGAPTAGQLSEGELAVDLTNKELYTKSGSTVIKIGGTGGGETGTFTDLTATSSFTSPGIDDNATSTAITIDAAENVGIGVMVPSERLDVLNAMAITGPAGPLLKMEKDDGSLDSVLYYNNANATNKLLLGRDSLELGFRTNGVERMTVDSSGNVGIGTASPADYVVAPELVVDTGVAGGMTIKGSGGTGSYGGVYFADGIGGDGYRGFVQYNHNNGGSVDDLIFGTASSEKMRITSSGDVGIGASNPAANNGKLVIGGVDSTNGNPQGSIAFTDGGNNGQARILSSRGTSFQKGSLDFQVAQGTVNSYISALTIAETGNVGIGTDTPTQASGSGLVVYDASTPRVTLRNSSTGDGTLDGASMTLVSSDLYVENRENGAIRFAANGGERMRIDASGNVGIGTDSPNAYSSYRTLEIQGGADAGGALRLSATEAEEYATLFNFNGNAYYGGSGQTVLGTLTNDSFTSSYLLTKSTHLWYDPSDGATERLRIGPTGNVGVNINLPTAKLHVHSGVVDTEVFKVSGFNTARGLAVGVYQEGGVTDALVDFNNILSNGRFSWSLGGTEKMRIDASGNLLVGTTSFSGGTDGFRVSANGRLTESSTNATTAKAHRAFYNPNGQVGSITTSGTATAYNTSSDQRLKENITDASSASDDIDAIQVRSFDWKADGSHQKYGFIAQELEVVAPYAVTRGEDEDDMMSVDYSKLVPMLVKEIQDLKAEVAALKGA